MAEAKPNQLPQRESGLFRSIVKFYETKQYKKGLKTADTILKKIPEHGETLAMKGLTLNCMGKKEEAYEFARRGLRQDMRSHVCWHVFGLLYRSDRDYPEAIKCYRNALRIDPENMQILRDLSLLQVQMRDLQGFAETRRTLLTIKPNNKNNWIGFAMAQHLCTNYNTALKVIDTYDKTQEPSSEPNYEDSEVLLYRNQIIMESGNLEKALTHLEEIEPLVVDKFHWRQTKATLLCRSEQYEQAKEEFLTMLKMNTENFEYHLGLQNAVLETSDYFELTGCDLPSSVIDLTESQCSTLQALYQELAEQYPRSSAIKRIPLIF